MILRYVLFLLSGILGFSTGLLAQESPDNFSRGKQIPLDSTTDLKGLNSIPGLIVKGNLTCLGNIIVNSGREVHIDSTGQIILNKSQSVPSITFNSGSRLKMSGNSTHRPGLIRTQPGYYQLNLNTGASISAAYGIFSNFGGEKGIGISSGVTVDTSASFRYCSFIGGYSSIPGASLLTFENDQHLVLRGLHFTQGDVTYNIRKDNAEGRILVGVTSGNFSGPEHENDPYNRVIWGGIEMNQTIPLPSGWSGLSSYMIPFTDNISGIFAEFENEFELLESLNLIYYPSQGIYTLTDWEQQAAYKIKMNNAVELTIHGFTESNQTFELTTGWNLMPVICNQPVNAVNLFGTLGTNFVVAKEVASDHIYWPEYGINTIGNLIPGKAYFVKVAGNSSVQFPDYVINPAIINSRISDSVASVPWRISGKSASSHIFALLPEALKNMRTGDIIGAFTEDNVCAGLAEVNSLNVSLPLVVFADDPGTAEEEGFTYGEPVQFRVFSPSDESTVISTAFYDKRLPDQGTFVPEGLSAVTFLKTEELYVQEGFDKNADVRYYPNPAIEFVNFYCKHTVNRLKIFGVDGRCWLEKTMDAGYSFHVDVSGLIPGVYHVELIGYEGSVVKKLIIGQ